MSCNILVQWGQGAILEAGGSENAFCLTLVRHLELCPICETLIIEAFLELVILNSPNLYHILSSSIQ